MIPHSVDTTVFGFSPGTLFNVDSVAKRSLIISSIAAAIGLFIDIWFIFAYSGADFRKFQVGPHSPLHPIPPTSRMVLTLSCCDTDARDGYLQLVLLLRTFFTPTARRSLRLSPRPCWLPLRRRVDRVACRGACNVRVDGRTSQPAVHRVRFPPPRTGLCVDAAWGLVGSGVCWEQSPGSFHA